MGLRSMIAPVEKWAISKKTSHKILYFIAVICAASVAYLILLTWAIAYAAMSEPTSGWRALIPSMKASTLSWLWLSHLVAVLLATLPIALAIRFCLTRRRLWVALSVSVVVFLTLLPALDTSVANQASYVIIWTIWEQVLLISALPTMVWIMEFATRHRG